jgi:hypothetical protein
VTPLEAAVDNDVLIKISCYSLTNELLQIFDGEKQIAVLGTARYVIAKRLGSWSSINNPVQAQTCWISLLSQVEELQPTEDEVRLATEIEECALHAGLQLDGGESQLCSIAIHRRIPRVVTGDKRAIIALESLIQHPTLDIEGIRNRVTCFEQLMLKLVWLIGGSEVKRRVCAEPNVDKSASICFSCSGGAIAFTEVGLESYIGSIRNSAPSLILEFDPA